MASIAFSSNDARYADMRHRMVSILWQFSMAQEAYFIDESFLDLSEFSHLELKTPG